MSVASRAAQGGNPRLIQAVVDAFRQRDVRQKLLFTIGLLVVFRFIAHVPIPGVDKTALTDAFQNNQILGMLNLFSGGALRKLSVAAMGVYPYITASIIMQLLTPLVPSFQALQREGESGRNRLQLYQHWLTVPLCVVQAYGQLIILQNAGVFVGGPLETIGFTGSAALPTTAAIISMTAGTMFLIWLGELITENGIGNGISLIIFAGIIASLPSLIPNAFNSGAQVGIILVLIIGLVLLAFMVFFQEAQRRIPVQYAKSVFRAGRMYRQSGQTHIPLRVNSAGMIPLIFAFSMMVFPGFVGRYLQDSGDSGFFHAVGQWMASTFNQQNLVFIGIVFLLVIAFTFFYSLVVFQQQNLAENLQKQGGFVPGIRPGRPTAEYIMRVLIRITWAGAIFLGLVAVIPMLVTVWSDVKSVALSGTGMIIVVGVVLDTMRQLEAQLMMRDYEGFIR